MKFKKLMAGLTYVAEMLCSNEWYEDNHFEILYLVHTEQLLQIKKMIDDDIKYEALELFEFVKWD